MVQGRCEVLAGQARRSGGGLPYRNYAEFAETLRLLLERPELRAQMGEAGRQYVVENYSWDKVIARYEDFIARIVEHAPPRRAGGGRHSLAPLGR